MEKELVADMERDALDSTLDPDLDHYCDRMRSETVQGDELTIRAIAGALRINIRVLKLNSTTATIMALTYPGTPPIDLEEGLGTSKSLGSDDPISKSLGSDIPEVVDDEESSDSVRDTHRKDDEDTIPIITSLTMDTEEPESPDQTHGSWATERVVAAAEKTAGLQRFQTGLRQKLTPNVWTSAGVLDQWLSGRNRRHPCRKLATLDPVKVSGFTVEAEAASTATFLATASTEST
jgi:hypothetical protein